MQNRRILTAPLIRTKGTMERNFPLDAFILILCILVPITASMAAALREGAITYIVHMDKSVMPTAFTTKENWYMSTLSSIKTLEDHKSVDDTLLYAYDNVMQGFSAKLTQSEVDALQGIPGYVASYPDSQGKFHTTHSPKFLGLQHKSGIWPKSLYGHDMIIGIIDSGVWPESESFNDKGMTEIPERWKGECQTGPDFNSSLCNKKLIGARYFNKGYVAQYGKINTTFDYDSPRDSDGHGTHTSSIAAGNFVRNVDYFGYAKGTAKGMAPRARVAMYKVGWNLGIMKSDVLAGIDRAIADGVDVLSISLGFDAGVPYYLDPLAQGSFAAMDRGIFVACSGGNNGPTRSTVTNVAPWMLTVGASTMDRNFVGRVKLGNGPVVQGTSYFVESLFLAGLPLIYNWKNYSSRVCTPDSLDPKLVAGKIVLCMNSDGVYGVDQVAEANRARAAGIIMVYENNFDLSPQEFIMPSVLLKSKQGKIVTKYATSASNPTVDLKFAITSLRSKPAPVVADFSSRGPNVINPGILKPDIVAPGTDILAAWPPNIPVAAVGLDAFVSDYKLDSGTSMSAPHVAAIAALVKSVHPEWSPAAIRSALMTTAYTLDNTGHTLTDLITGSAAGPLDYGAGQVNPNKATDPGLVYDLSAHDYVKFLCTLNYTRKELLLITRGRYSCPGGRVSSNDLNYPSFVANLGRNSSSKNFKTFKRTVTNVGDAGSVYKAVVKAPQAVSVQVEPRVLVFNEKNQRLSFSMRMKIDEGVRMPASDVTYGYLIWVDANHDHVVKSPLVAIFD